MLINSLNNLNTIKIYVLFLPLEKKKKIQIFYFFSVPKKFPELFKKMEKENRDWGEIKIGKETCLCRFPKDDAWFNLDSIIRCIVLNKLVLK